jgi:hypothetical protein
LWWRDPAVEEDPETVVAVPGVADCERAPTKGDDRCKSVRRQRIGAANLPAAEVGDQVGGGRGRNRDHELELLFRNRRPEEAAGVGEQRQRQNPQSPGPTPVL